jgi:hypothetical protein
MMGICLRSVDLFQYLVVLAGYVLAIATSGLVVRGLIGTDEGPSAEDDGKGASGKTKYDLGTIIGKCENFLVITLVLADALTGLALVFTAKSIVRADSIKRNPRYYLGGTVVNFTYSVFIGFAIKVILAATGHSL